MIADSVESAAPESVQELVAPTAEAVAEIEADVVVAPALEDRIPVGSVLERTKHGWHVRIMYGGVPRLHGDGETLAIALTEAGV